jgi:hypothetical protein
MLKEKEKGNLPRLKLLKRTRIAIVMKKMNLLFLVEGERGMWLIMLMYVFFLLTSCLPPSLLVSSTYLFYQLLPNPTTTY